MEIIVYLFFINIALSFIGSLWRLKNQIIRGEKYECKIPISTACAIVFSGRVMGWW